MAQLSRDDEAFGALMTLEEASTRVATLASPVAEVETVPLAQADGRVLARDIAAPLDLPPFANSAVDGYAVRHADLALAGASRLPVSGRVAAGADAAGVAVQGVAVRVFTGAPMPESADTVFMQEDVVLEGPVAVLPPGLAKGANARPAGEDIARSAPAAAAGLRLRPQDLALFSALGLSEVAVRRRPRVAVFSTGDELTEPGQPLGPAAIYDANRALLRAMVTRAGAEVVDLGILRDEPAGLARSLAQAAGSCDLVLTSGGVSTGEEDHVKAALEQVGDLAFWRIGIKPGRPVALGRIGAVPFIGLPGNPVAVFVTFAFVARVLIARLAGTDSERPVALPVRLGFPYRKKEGRREYVRVSLEPGPDGIMIARKHPQDGAGVLTSLTRTDGLVELAEDTTRIAEGTVVPFLAYGLLFG
ncbi:MAG: molybdopterin molybdotransferase MoeA [Bosea sp. (in: a-proteobacteria)]|uniref:molybdopterin molybdotransferase MoeA n=1 Tax=Bosea sp. (in: a-proteobacteria) TaxID=1871050 RepID=UPI002734A0FC|nr:gephyrin-like molybdotransferase Glp [Bosea sp. (in: a-proteobacteria)]MDP3256470.1 molybdopterin molybdotransferase MoeA [Bosea sp. (in: a-proteobacteria)]MDP3317693.1 molybdopterin molybdotransferase MoeA [Bosea sp. (in: a-proteobacteria)]